MNSIGASALWPLVEALEYGDQRLSRAAAEALGKLDDRRACGPLIKALADVEKSVRRAAAEALAKLGEPSWQAVVMGEPQDWERLANCGDARAFGLLIRQLGDASSSVPAARALGKLGDKRAVGPLIQGLAESPKSNIGREELEAEERWGGFWYAAAKALGELGDALAVEALIKRMTAGEYGQRNICIAAAEALGKLGDTRAVEPLIRWLPRCDIRDHRVSEAEKRRGCAAAEALGKLGDPRAAEPLVHAPLDAGYRGDVGEVCEAAAEALRRLGDKHAVEPLIRGLSG